MLFDEENIIIVQTNSYEAPVQAVNGKIGFVTITIDDFIENLVYTTGNQTISGTKTFDTRPTVNGTSVLLSGEAASFTLPDTVVLTTGDQTISGNKDFYGDEVIFSGTNVTFIENTGIVYGAWQFSNRPKVNGTGVLLSGDEINSRFLNIFPKGQTPLTRMPFGIKGNTAFASTNLVTGRASIVPFPIGETITGYKAVSQRIGNTTNGPWTVRVALYNINSGIYSPSFIESVDVNINSTTNFSRQTVANFTGNGNTLQPGWYAHVSWFVSGNGAITNSSNFTWSNRAIIGNILDTSTANDLPGSTSELFYLISNLTGSFYTTGSPTGIGTLMTTDTTLTNAPWYFPYY